MVNIDRRIPRMPICRDDMDRRCIYNGEVCNCSVYAGNPKFPLRIKVDIGVWRV